MKKAKEKHKTNKTQKGITLIALVVTIVILLILAGITITTLFGENGLITTAKLADQKTQEGAQNDLDAMNGLSGKIDELTGIEPEPAEGTLLAMYKAGQSCANPETCTDANHLHIGDYVNYTEPTSGGYTITAENSGMDYDQHYTLSSTVNNLNWRVLGKDKETKGIKLIADIPMTLDDNEKASISKYLFLKGAEAYEYGPTEMNKACEMYKNGYAVKARSVNMLDIDEITGKTTDALREEVNFWTLQGLLPLGSTMSFTEKQWTPQGWLNYQRALKEAEGVTTTGVKMQQKPYSIIKLASPPSGGTEDQIDPEQYKTDLTDQKTTGYAYAVEKGTTTGAITIKKVSQAAPEPNKVIINNSRIYDMLFKDTDFGKGAYWLASRGVVADSDFARFGPGGVGSEDGVALAGSCYGYSFNSVGNAYVGGLAVRPVVCLAPEVTAEQIQKIDDVANDWGTAVENNQG